MPSLNEKIAESMDILDRAVREHAPVAMYGMLSGGHDSVCANHIASRHPSFTRSVHINTTIGIRETRLYARERALQFGWSLIEMRPPVSYREIILEHGFPGPGGHSHMYRRLKERPIRQLVRETKTRWKDRVGLVTGVRSDESVRRMGNVEPIAREGAKLWVAPIINWTDEDKLAYMEHCGIPRNPVVDTICMSGECLCGAFAKKEELVELEVSFPEVAAGIHALQDEALLEGVHAKWGTRPPGARRKATKGGMLCATCNRKNGL